MQEMVMIVLIVLWVLGMVSAHALGGFIHLLLLLAVIVGLVRFFQGKRPR